MFDSLKLKVICSKEQISLIQAEKVLNIISKYADVANFGKIAQIKAQLYVWALNGKSILTADETNAFKALVKIASNCYPQ